MSKYKIILDGYEPKWKRRQTAIKKVVNQRNLDKGLSQISKFVGAISSGIGGSTGTTARRNKKSTPIDDMFFGKKSKRNTVKIWSTLPPKKSKGKSRHKPKSIDEQIWGSKPKRKNKTVKIYSSKNNVKFF